MSDWVDLNDQSRLSSIKFYLANNASMQPWASSMGGGGGGGNARSFLIIFPKPIETILSGSVRNFNSSINFPLQNCQDLTQPAAIVNDDPMTKCRLTRGSRSLGMKGVCGFWPSCRTMPIPSIRWALYTWHVIIFLTPQPHA